MTRSRGPATISRSSVNLTPNVRSAIRASNRPSQPTHSSANDAAWTRFESKIEKEQQSIQLCIVCSALDLFSAEIEGNKAALYVRRELQFGWLASWIFSFQLSSYAVWLVDLKFHFLWNAILYSGNYDSSNVCKFCHNSMYHKKLLTSCLTF